MKQSIDQIVALINQANGTTVPADAVTLDAPTPWSAEGDYRNTEVVAHGVLEKGYSGQQPFQYRRIDLGLLFNAVIVTVVIPHHNATSEDVVDELNKQFSELDLVAGDMIHEPVPDDATSYTLRADPTSLYYIGAVEVIVERVLQDISLELTVTSLNGFDYIELIP